MGAQFFKASPQSVSQQSEKYEAIDVGGEQFHAVAVALIDYFQSGSPINVELIKKYLARLSLHYPQSFSNNNDSLTTPKEHLTKILNYTRKSELVERTAYVLRQFAVNELYRDYLNLAYRDVFKGLTPDTPKSYLRNPNVPLPVSALKALDNALELPITLSFKGPGQELGKKEKGNSKQQVGLVIQVQEDGYYPVVKQKELFTQISSLAMATKPEEIPEEQEGTMANILTGISGDNQERLRAYEHQEHTILTMFKAKEVTREELRNFYIDLSSNRTTDTALFIRKLAQGKRPVNSSVSIDTKQAITDFASALASLIAAGVCNEAELYDRIDNISTPTLAG